MSLIDNILLAPYSLFLRLRHFLYDHGVEKVHSADVPSICIGNITVGGTGKTPHTELLLRLLSGLPEWKDRRIAVLSRGYKRRSSGFLEVTADGSARQVGDEPLQIKKKFPDVTVAVDRDRVHGCRILKEQDTDLIILEDAFQYRRLRADASIVLVDWNRPIFKDHLLPIGRLRDLPSRIRKADMVIVSKCPSYLREEDAKDFADRLGFKGDIFFTSMFYDEYRPVFPEGDPRYTHAKRLILFTGIANDSHLFSSLSLRFRIVRHFQFGDHHKYTSADLTAIRKAAEWFATAVIVTTEKDAQRLLDCPNVPKIIRERLFYVPVRMDFLSPGETERFTTTLLSYLQ
ncbi:MAG: tetraacyldisaccharide 4'-kinase [Bacteroidales bacterium]|nr:tetraacyldisaccharide 4'-kinase [Bacteroidales bacterium]